MMASSSPDGSTAGAAKGSGPLEAAKAAPETAPPDEFADHAFCPECFTIDPGDDYCGSCGERLS